MSVFYDTSANLHPYECDGPGECPHCDREHTTKHNPDTCALCDEGMTRDPDKSDTAIYGAGGGS